MLSGCIYRVLVADARRGLKDIAAGHTQAADTAIAALQRLRGAARKGSAKDNARKRG
jgi:hypothetical protein